MLAASFVIRPAHYAVAGIHGVMALLARSRNKHFGYAQIPVNSGCA